MTTSIFDSALYAGLFPTKDARRLFTDTAEVRAMLVVQGALAKVQGEMGVIPEISAAAIHRASLEVQIDPAGLADATGQNGVCAPALVAAFREAMQAPEHAQFIHWGATSQDVIDTGLMMRLRQTLALIEADLRRALHALADLAEAHANTPMAGRTYGQHATVTSFGAVAAGWGMPLLHLLDELPELRARSLVVSLSGAAGTSAALGQHAADIRAQLAVALKLNDPGYSWHTDRTPLIRISHWMVRVTTALQKLGEDLIALTQTGIGEVVIGGGGASSTMPQKQNPVGPSALVALGRLLSGTQAILQGSSSHAHQRDGAGWFTEWMTVPQISLGAASAISIAAGLVCRIDAAPDQMTKAIADGLGLVHAEALSFALTDQMSRTEAQIATKRLCQKAAKTGQPLADVALDEWPELSPSVFEATTQMGRAPEEAILFVKKVRAVA